MNQIIPAILAKDEQEFRSRLAIVEEHADAIQLDVLDDTLYPNTSWCEMNIIDTLDTAIFIELHLMTKNPATIVAKINHGGPVHRVIWHIEAPIDHADLIATCRSFDIEVGLAIAPRTSIEALRPFAESVDEILVLGVEPGFSGQSLIPHTIQNARDIHRNWPSIVIGFDGGVTAHAIPQLRGAGVTRLYAASALWNAPDPQTALTELQRA